MTYFIYWIPKKLLQAKELCRQIKYQFNSEKNQYQKRNYKPLK